MHNFNLLFRIVLLILTLATYTYINITEFLYYNILSIMDYRLSKYGELGNLCLNKETIDLLLAFMIFHINIRIVNLWVFFSE